VADDEISTKEGPLLLGVPCWGRNGDPHLLYIFYTSLQPLLRNRGLKTLKLRE